MSDQITFSEQPLGTVNPIYTFADNTVTCIGEIVSDSADPGSPAIAANTSYLGSIFIDFQNALSQVSFAAGYFDNLESTEIILIGSDGSVLFDTMNEDLGYVPYSYTATNNIGVSSIEVLVRGFDASGFSADSINFTTIAQLFTSGADQVNFNNLNSNQKTAIVNGSDEFHGSGGSDTVVLPSVANFNESVGSAKTLGWTNTSASEFFTQSQVGDTYNVSGTDGNYVIAAGQGTDNISISGAGKSTFFAGNGSDSVVIKGGGTLVVSGALLGSA